MKNAIILSLLVVIALLALDRPHHGEAQAMIQDTKADFPSCVTVRPSPLLRTPGGRLDYRLGKPSNDRGDT